MIVSAGDPQAPGHVQTDVAIVGAGPAGIALALRLEEKGVDCVLLEAGGPKLERASQEFYRAAEITPDEHGPVHLYRRRALGGTSAVWGGRCIPFDPIDFEDRPWIPHARWPIGHQEVASFYAEALAFCRAGPAVFHAAQALPDDPGPMIEDAFDPDLILDRIERFSEPTHFGRAYYERMAQSRRIQLMTYANAVEILTSADGGTARGVVVASPNGRRIQVDARRVVLCNGALETPRLLLASRAVRSCGLGNEKDLVGRFYQGHLEGEVAAIRFNIPDPEVRLDYDRSPEGIYCRRYICLSPEAQRREALGGLILRPHHPKIADPSHGNGVLSAMFLVKDLIVPEYGRKMTSTEQAARKHFGAAMAGLYLAHVGNVVRSAPSLAGFALDWVRRRNLASRKLPSVVLRDRRGCYTLDVNAEQTPNPESRVALAQEQDSFGVPRLAIHWRTTAQDRDMLARGVALLADRLNASGKAQVSFEEDGLAAAAARCTRIGGHHIGTARMAESPRDGVVDRHCEVFGVKGLYVSGAATFPTSGFANPTLTIIALALRLADHLATKSTATTSKSPPQPVS
jgi:choline dehydrogenase-like flavoprotein